MALPRENVIALVFYLKTVKASSDCEKQPVFPGTCLSALIGPLMD